MDSIISSPANERLKHARRVRDGREEGLIFIEGERLSEECVSSGLEVVACFHSPHPTERSGALIEELLRAGCPVYRVADSVLGTVTDTVHPQGVVVIARRPEFSEADLAAGGEGMPLLVCLDGVQDPGNFGTLVRTAEAAGASGVVALKGCVDGYSPKALRASMGSAFRLPVVSGLDGNGLPGFVRERGLKLVTASAEGGIVYTDFDWRQGAAVIFGNEARGVSRELMERCDAVVRIPLRGGVESLNVSAAAAVVLFEAARQRR